MSTPDPRLQYPPGLPQRIGRQLLDLLHQLVDQLRAVHRWIAYAEWGLITQVDTDAKTATLHTATWEGAVTYGQTPPAVGDWQIGYFPNVGTPWIKTRRRHGFVRWLYWTVSRAAPHQPYHLLRTLWPPTERGTVEDLGDMRPFFPEGFTGTAGPNNMGAGLAHYTRERRELWWVTAGWTSFASIAQAQLAHSTGGFPYQGGQLHRFPNYGLPPDDPRADPTQPRQRPTVDLGWQLLLAVDPDANGTGRVSSIGWRAHQGSVLVYRGTSFPITNPTLVQRLDDTIGFTLNDSAETPWADLHIFPYQTGGGSLVPPEFASGTIFTDVIGSGYGPTGNSGSGPLVDVQSGEGSSLTVGATRVALLPILRYNATAGHFETEAWLWDDGHGIRQVSVSDLQDFYTRPPAATPLYSPRANHLNYNSAFRTASRDGLARIEPVYLAAEDVDQMQYTLDGGASWTPLPSYLANDSAHPLNPDLLLVDIPNDDPASQPA